MCTEDEGTKRGLKMGETKIKGRQIKNVQSVLK